MNCKQSGGISIGLIVTQREHSVEEVRSALYVVFHLYCLHEHIVPQRSEDPGQAKGLRGWRRPFGWMGFRLLGGGLSLAGVGLGELAAEALDAAGGVDQLLLAGEEGVAGGADFENDVALVRGAGGGAVAAGALDRDFVVLRMNSLFRHGDFPFLARISSVS